MAWDGSGNFTRTNGTQTGSETWADSDAAGNDITTSEHDTHDQDLSDGIAACITKNNESKPTADFLPNTDADLDLGSAVLRWANLYMSGAIHGFTQSGTGAIDRTYTDKARDIVSSADFCDGGGVVDDTAAFNHARTAALGKTLYVTGTPLIKSAMTISSREHWVFAGAVGNSNGGLPGSYLVKGSALNGDLVTITADGTLIENGGILGQGSAQGAGGTGYTVNANGVHLSRPYVAWMKSHGIRVGSDVDGGNSNSFDFYHPVCLQNGGHGIFADDANVGATVSAGAFVTDTYYFIKVVGTTDFTLIGAKSNTVGELFIATGVGAGNGTAYEAQPNANGGVINAPFTQSNASDGIRFDRAWANTVVGGVSEQNTGYGIDFEKGSYGNEIFNLDYYENNTAGDVNWVNGAHNNIVWGRSGATPPTKTTLRGNGNAMYGERPVGLAHCGTLTRDRTAAGANVSYTGVGFCPSRIEFRAVVENSANPNSYGWTDGLNNYCNYMIAGSTSLFASAVRCIWSEDTPNAATAEIGSFDRDGFTLVWYKVNAPAAGNITVQYIAHR